MIANRLNKRIEVYGKGEITNALGETDFSYTLVKKIWAEIVPTAGSKQQYQGETERADISHKITIRSNAIALTNDMYFMYKGQRYDVNYFMPNYKYNDSIEVFCSLVVE